MGAKGFSAHLEDEMNDSERIRRRAEHRTEEQMAKERKRQHDKAEAIRRKGDRHTDELRTLLDWRDDR